MTFEMKFVDISEWNEERCREFVRTQEEARIDGIVEFAQEYPKGLSEAPKKIAHEVVGLLHKFRPSNYMLEPEDVNQFRNTISDDDYFPAIDMMVEGDYRQAIERLGLEEYVQEGDFSSEGDYSSHAEYILNVENPEMKQDYVESALGARLGV